MCLNATGHEFKVAKKDVRCYKVMLLTYNKKKATSEYRNFKYEFNKEYSKRGKLKKVLFEIHHGFHSFTLKKEAKRYMKGDIYNLYYIFKCTIPKGATYIKGIFKQGSLEYPNYASTKIIINKICA